MFGGLRKSTSVFALAAVAGLAMGSMSAQAADFGGDCCADLEERVAELEATTARKGNRKVSLTIYDVKGARVKHLVDDLLSPREYEREWDGTDERGVPVASGVYYYRLKVDGRALSKKVVVITR